MLKVKLKANCNELAVLVRQREYKEIKEELFKTLIRFVLIFIFNHIVQQVFNDINIRAI